MFEVLSAPEIKLTGDLTAILLIVITALSLSTALSTVYRSTFRGFAYSKNHAQSIILASIISAVIVQAAADSLTQVLAILAAMAIVLFRANGRDSREMLFLFASLAAGVTCGVQAFGLAIIGTLAFSATALFLHYSPLGSRCHFDGMLRFNLPNQSADRSRLEQTMQHYCQAFSLVSMCEIDRGARLEYAYQIKLRQGENHLGLLAELKTLESLSNINLISQTDQL